MKTPALLTAAVAAALFLAAPASAASAPKNTLEVAYMPSLDYPESLIRRGIMEAEVGLVLSIDPDGRVADWLVTATTDPAFETLVADLLRDIEFKLPAAPGPVRVAMTLHFQARGAVVSHTVNDTVDTLVNRMLAPRRIDKLGTPRQLDRPLAPVRTVSPLYPEAPAGPGSRVVLDFLIDETGRVRMPVLHAGEDRVLANAATNALLEWRFDPPTRAGQPVIVAARQEFRFPAR